MSKKAEQNMTTKQFAEKMNVNYRTALNWLEAGIVPKAVKREIPTGVYWEISPDALQMERPKPGPKPKNANGKAKTKKAQKGE